MLFRSEPSYSGAGGSPWDVSLWNVTSWSGTLSPKKNWQSLASIGYAGSFRMRVVAKNFVVQWAATDIEMAFGGTL